MSLFAVHGTYDRIEEFKAWISHMVDLMDRERPTGVIKIQIEWGSEKEEG